MCAINLQWNKLARYIQGSASWCFRTKLYMFAIAFKCNTTRFTNVGTRCFGYGIWSLFCSNIHNISIRIRCVSTVPLILLCNFLFFIQLTFAYFFQIFTRTTQRKLLQVRMVLNDRKSYLISCNMYNNLTFYFCNAFTRYLSWAALFKQNISDHLAKTRMFSGFHDIKFKNIYFLDAY